MIESFLYTATVLLDFASARLRSICIHRELISTFGIMSGTPWKPTGIIRTCPHQCSHFARPTIGGCPLLAELVQLLVPGGRSYDHLNAVHGCGEDHPCGQFKTTHLLEPEPYGEVRAWIIWGKILEMRLNKQDGALKLNKKEKGWLDKVGKEGLAQTQWNEVFQNSPYLSNPPRSLYSHGGVGPTFGNVQYPDIALHPSLLGHCRQFLEQEALCGRPCFANGVRGDQPRFLGQLIFFY